MSCNGVVCDNCFFGGKKVPYKGNIKSPFVIVGESPGGMELAKGIPFIGPSGELLDSTLAPYIEELRAAGCEPLVTNAIQCMPRQKDPNRLSQAVRACNARLMAELSAHPRKVILTLGNGATWAVTDNHNLKITQVRGNVYESDLASEGIVTAVHPSFLLRGSGNLQQFRRDISLAVSKVLGKEVTLDTEVNGLRAAGKFTPGKNIIISSQAEYKQLCRMLQDVDVVSGDFETDGFNPRARIPNPPSFVGKGILSLGLSFETGVGYVIPGELVNDEIFQNEAQWVWHNGKYDIGWGREYGMDSIRVDDDTLLMSYCLNERGGVHDLEQVGGDWLQSPNYKNMLEVHLPSKKHSYAYIPEDVLYEYQGIDAQLTFALRSPMREKIRADKRLNAAYERILLPASEFLSTVERNGLYPDVEAVAENEERLGAIADKHRIEFCRIAESYGFDNINIGSWQQIQKFLYGELKLAPISTSTDADTLEKLIGKQVKDTIQHQVLNELLSYRKVHKQLSTFVIPYRELRDTDGRIHTTFKLHGTTTGRLSSSRPNVQNVPRDKAIRGQFQAAPGWVYLDVDLSQAELRVLACLSGDVALAEIFASGKSLHDEVAAYLFGPDYVKYGKSGDSVLMAIAKEWKMIAKNINFGIVYGITASGLVGQLESNGSQVSIKDAQNWIDGWFERFPQAHTFIMRCRAAPGNKQTLVTPFGRKRRFGVVGYDNIRALQNEAANFPEQSPAHDITLLAGIELAPELADDYGAKFVNEIHDALIIEMPNKAADLIRAARQVVKVMERIPVDWGMTEVPFKAEAEIGVKWGSCTKIEPFAITANELKYLEGKSYETIFEVASQKQAA